MNNNKWGQACAAITTFGATAEFVDGEMFRTIIRLGETVEKTVEKSSQKTTQKATPKTTQKIIEFIGDNPQITRNELAEIIGITPDGIKYNLDKLKKEKRFN